MTFIIIIFCLAWGLLIVAGAKNTNLSAWRNKTQPEDSSGSVPTSGFEVQTEIVCRAHQFPEGVR
jgi:hypothetical protein